MLRRCRQYNDDDMDAIADERLRALIKGVVAGSRTPEVVNAFRILYEDYLPLRVSGDFIFGRVDSVITNAVRSGKAAGGARGEDQQQQRRRRRPVKPLTKVQVEAELTYVSVPSLGA
mmetsp:Transcript_21173/g.64484  ORF Transcript_21173/g.64484 Transcript_21173/m.64484 type:complete len:117 (-) Transcript_21173:495-845(-)